MSPLITTADHGQPATALLLQFFRLLSDLSAGTLQELSQWSRSQAFQAILRCTAGRWTVAIPQTEHTLKEAKAINKPWHGQRFEYLPNERVVIRSCCFWWDMLLTIEIQDNIYHFAYCETVAMGQNHGFSHTLDGLASNRVVEIQKLDGSWGSGVFV